MDYVNSDYAPDLLKFMKIKVDGQKTRSYYGFLKGIGEDVPFFSETQVDVINYLSNLMPLVRRHEFLVVKYLLDGITSEEQIQQKLAKEISGYAYKQYEHTLRFMEDVVVKRSNGEIRLACETTEQFKVYLWDLLEYGLSQYMVRYKDEDEFLMYQEYRQDQVLLKILDNPQHNQLGTYYKEEDGKMFIFAGLKKDDSIQEHLNYKDKFIDDRTFQWESVANIRPVEVSKQKATKKVYVFVRKVKSENGITLPYTFVGCGQLQNPREGITTNGSILYDIHMDTPLPNELMEDFQWTA